MEGSQRPPCQRIVRHVEALDRTSGAALVSYPLPCIASGNVGDARQLPDHLEYGNASVFHALLNAKQARKLAQFLFVAAISFSKCLSHAFTSQKGLGV
jgi:hypothetical protein